MRKIQVLSISIFFLCSFGLSGLGQEHLYAAKVAQYTCECLSKNIYVNDSVFSYCLIASMKRMGGEELENEALSKLLNDRVRVRNILVEADSLVMENCDQMEKFPYAKEKRKYLNFPEDINILSEHAFSYGMDLIDNGDYEGGIEKLRMAVKHDSTFVLAMDNLALAYRHIEQYPNAIRLYKKSISIFPQDDNALLGLGAIYTLLNRNTDASIYYSKLVQYYPLSPEGYYGLGKNYLVLNDYEKAISNAAQAQKIYASLHSEYVKDANKLMALIYLQMKDENKEKKFYKLAFKYHFDFSHLK